MRGRPPSRQPIGIPGAEFSPGWRGQSIGLAALVCRQEGDTGNQSEAGNNRRLAWLASFLGLQVSEAAVRLVGVWILQVLGLMGDTVSILTTQRSYSPSLHRTRSWKVWSGSLLSDDANILKIKVESRLFALSEFRSFGSIHFLR